MSLRLSVLGSGSGGNATLLHIAEPDDGQERFMLIDAGFSPREITKRMATLGIDREQLEAVILTHMHGDHIREAWLDVFKQQGIHVYLHQRHYRLWNKMGRYDVPTTRFDKPFQLTPSTKVLPFLLPHDQQSCAGLLIEHDGLKLGYMTDLGHVPEGAYKHFVGMDMLAIESNYDPQLQQASRRPAFLKRRVMGRLGHLSNEQSIQAVLRLSNHSGLGRILLLHLSQQCNDPEIIRDLYAAQAPHLQDRVLPTKQRHPTDWIELEAAPAPQGLVQDTTDTPSTQPQLELF